MVTTRSRGNSAKHEAPKAESELPTKKRKTSKTTKKEIEANGKPDENIEEPVPEKPETANGKKEDNEQDGKPPAAEPEAAKAEVITAGHAPRDSSHAESPILEKGVFYFFFRPRVNVEDVSSINDVQRSYLLLRPLKKSDVDSASKDLRMILIPKKQLPSTGTHERFLGFVGSPDEHIKDLKDDIGENTYNTATRGERTQGAARPVAEGVYAIVGDPDGRTTHFAYLLTMPSHASEVQKEFGLSDKGSYIMSTRNPATPAPPQAKGLQSAEYPETIKNQFRDRRWMNLLPEHLDYQYTQILFIGEKSSITGDQNVLEQLEKLEDEDEARVKHLKGDEAVYKDLELSKKDFLPGALHGELE